MDANVRFLIEQYRLVELIAYSAARLAATTVVVRTAVAIIRRYKII